MYGWLPDVCDDSSQVVTASRRLARQLTSAYNARQIAQGKSAWLTPVIVAWPDWLSRLSASAMPGSIPARLNTHQGRVLWEQVLDEVIHDPLVNIPGLSRHARDAWKGLHEWRVPVDECIAAASSRDQRVFAAAVSRYRDARRSSDRCSGSRAPGSAGTGPARRFRPPDSGGGIPRRRTSRARQPSRVNAGGTIAGHGCRDRLRRPGRRIAHRGPLGAYPARKRSRATAGHRRVRP